MKRVILALALVLAASAPARAGWGEASAAYLLGDYATAYREFLPRARQGDAIAQYSLGNMYNNGHGVAQDHAEAARWYRLAAEQGDATAQYNLGLMYHEGKGVAQDYVQALKWYNLAAANEPPGEVRDQAARHRDLVGSRMTPAQIARAQELARDFKPKPSTPAR